LIDLFAIGLTHALIALVCLRVLKRPDLDVAGDGLCRSAAEERNTSRKGKRAKRA
jgi:hypothetical protein